MTCSYRYFTDDLYPLRLLPKTNFIVTLSLNEILVDYEIFLIRKTHLPPKEIFNEFGNLKPDVISIKDFPSLSMNMTGGLFKISDIRFRPKMHTSATQNWNGEDVKLKDHLHDYEVVENQYPILFYFKDLNNVKIPFRSKGKEAARLVKLLNLPLTPDSQTGEYERIGKSIVNHVPLKLNYWHVELELQDDLNQTFSKIKNQWAISAANHLVEHILSKKAIEWKNQKFINLPTDTYTKEKNNLKIA